MNVLITGANGFIGRALVKHLHSSKSSNVKVRASIRHFSDRTDSELDDFLETGDLANNVNLDAVLEGIDVIIHLAARVHALQNGITDHLTEFRRVNVDGTLNLARQALQANVRRFIFISSIKVNGEATQPGQPFHADDSPAPEDAYGVSKYEAEDGLRKLCMNSNMDFVIIRPPIVYGPGVKGNFLSLMRWLDKGIPLPLRSIQNKRSLIAVDNLVDLITTCIDHPAAANQIFLASDGEDLSTPDLLRRTAAALNKRAILLPIPEAVLNFIALCLGKSAAFQKLCASLQMDISKTRERLDWHPPCSIDQALHATAQYYLGIRK